jgi:uncharacterized cofD-like protein
VKNNSFKSLLYETGIYSGGPRIVTIGGGTGLSVLLRGLKKYTSNLTAIVTVADDGGGSGTLREDMGMLPPGDIRNCLVALANTEPIIESLMQYRFKEGQLKGQSFGNLFIAALNDICGSFDEAIKEMSNVLAVTGKVLPVTLEDVVLFAELEDGTLVKGESQIPIKQQTTNQRIKKIFIKPTNCKALPEAIEEILNADAIILGPGSLYTSIIPNLLVKDISKAIARSTAMKLYVSNLMTQKGETIGYSLADHIETIYQHGGGITIDYALVNNGVISDYFLEKYSTENASPVKIDYNVMRDMKIKLIEEDFVSVEKQYLRHNYNHLSEVIFELINEERLAKDKKRIVDYYYVNGKLKKQKAIDKE